MVKISFSPATELIVHEVVMVAQDDLLRERVTPAGTMPLYWCNGILFSFSSLPLSEGVTKDYMDGKIHWLEVHFAKADTYTPVLTLHDEEYKGTMSIRVIDTSMSELHREFVKWLKTNVKK
jgi:hypothetical protein